MKKEKIETCIQLTNDIMTNHFKGLHKLIEEHMHKDCFWIGSNAFEYYQGKEKILNVLKKESKELPKVILSSKEFQCITNDRNSCVIVGCYYGVTDRSSGQIYRDLQRVTFTWKEEDGHFWLTHMHVSNPLNNVEENEIFPHGIGKYTKEYLDMLIKKEVERSGFINIKDKEHIVHQLQISDIIYLEAFNMNTLIHSVDGDIFARVLISELENEINLIQEGVFVRIHKSFCVNKYYVTSIKRYEVKIANQFTAPISKDKYMSARQQLHL